MKIKYLPLENHLNYNSLFKDTGYYYIYKFAPLTSPFLICLFGFLLANLFLFIALTNEYIEILKLSLFMFYLPVIILNFMGGLFGTLGIIFNFLLSLVTPLYVLYQIIKYIFLIVYIKKYPKYIKISALMIEIPKTLFSKNQKNIYIPYEAIKKVTYCRGIFLPNSSHNFNCSHLLIETINYKYIIDTDFMSREAFNNLKILLAYKEIQIDCDRGSFSLNNKHR
ncbi:hypothetical protein [Planktothricoides raciborskii]|uniref:Uncharacterized protein n=1 Tax=Planktothricoides raciborskii GIHE-MW2 TaxID=2792601 RepID=A0AAU8JLK4_9CYAN